MGNKASPFLHNPLSGSPGGEVLWVPLTALRRPCYEGSGDEVCVLLLFSVSSMITLPYSTAPGMTGATGMLPELSLDLATILSPNTLILSLAEICLVRQHLLDTYYVRERHSRAGNWGHQNKREPWA